MYSMKQVCEETDMTCQALAAHWEICGMASPKRKTRNKTNRTRV